MAEQAQFHFTDSFNHDRYELQLVITENRFEFAGD
jgi:hypothetical protein